METTEIKPGENPYDRILFMFKSDDDIREWMKTPFSLNGKSMATNSVAIAIINNELTSEFKNLESGPKEQVLRITTFNQNFSFDIEVEYLLNIIAKCPMVPEINEEQTECEACSGTGEIEADFFHNGKYYDIEADCPVCDGYGVKESVTKPSEKLVMDPNYKLYIGVSLFNVKYIKRLLDVAHILNESKITLIYQSGPNNASIFKIGQCDILVMPMSDFGEDKSFILCEIKVGTPLNP